MIEIKFRSILAATMISPILALHAEAEILEVQCTYPNGEPIVYQFDMEGENVFLMGDNDDVENFVLIWNDRVIGWANIFDDEQFSMIHMLMLDRSTLILQSSWISNMLPAMAGMDRLVQCVRPI